MILSEGLLDVTRQITTALPMGATCGAVMLVVESDDGTVLVHSLSGQLVMTEAEAKKVIINMLIDIVNQITAIESV